MVNPCCPMTFIKILYHLFKYFLKKLFSPFFMMGKMPKRKRSLILSLSIIVLIVAVPIAILKLNSPNSASAAWFDDSWAYRITVPITDTVTEIQKYGTLS